MNCSVCEVEFTPPGKKRYGQPFLVLCPGCQDAVEEAKSKNNGWQRDKPLNAGFYRVILGESEEAPLFFELVCLGFNGQCHVTGSDQEVGTLVQWWDARIIAHLAPPEGVTVNEAPKGDGG